jgi:hypothetical protein
MTTRQDLDALIRQFMTKYGNPANSTDQARTAAAAAAAISGSFLLADALDLLVGRISDLYGEDLGQPAAVPEGEQPGQPVAGPEGEHLGQPLAGPGRGHLAEQMDKLRVELDELSQRVLDLDQRELGEQVDTINTELEELQGQFKKLRKKVKDR